VKWKEFRAWATGLELAAEDPSADVFIVMPGNQLLGVEPHLIRLMSQPVPDPPEPAKEGPK
jgi:hypothetical protein